MKTRRLAACPACGGPNFDAVPIGAHSLRRCRGCDTVSAEEYGDPDELYQDGYLTSEGTFGLNALDPVLQKYLIGVNDERVRALEKIVGHKGSVIDVGCGTGEFLGAAARHGWEAVGVDPVGDSAKHCREAYHLDVRAAMLQESGFPERSFDVVSALHVLEHMTDSREFLNLIKRWAKPGGHILIEVPNFRSAFRRGHGETWPHLRPLEHLVHFEPATLRRTFQRAGLEPVAIRTPSYFQYTPNYDYAVGALGLNRWAPRLRRFAVAGDEPGPDGQQPSKLLWLGLRATDLAYRRAKVGMVVYGVARVA